MSRTTRKLPRGYYRHPKGHKQARVNKVRPGAIPPDPWEDIGFDKETQAAVKVIDKLLKDKVPEEEIVKRIHKKFNLPKYRIVKHLESKKWTDIYLSMRRRQYGLE